MTSDNDPAAQTPLPDPLEVEGVELSLDELGRAYARASGMLVDEPDSDTQPTQVQEDDDAACELSPKSILEAILFVGSPQPDQPLTTHKIASWIRGVSPAEVTQLAAELQREYETFGSAFRVHQKNNQLQLVLAKEYEPVRDSFYGEVRKARLSQPAIDVLAIVAYHQPVDRERVNALRGRDCGAILNQLVKRKLLAAAKGEQQPAVKLYRTTERFLELFQLESLDDLPQTEEIMLPE